MKELRRALRNTKSATVFGILIFGSILLLVYMVKLRTIQDSSEAKDKSLELDRKEYKEFVYPINLVCMNGCKSVTIAESKWIIGCQALNKHMRMQLWDAKNLMQVVFRRERLEVTSILESIDSDIRNFLTKLLVSYHFGGIVLEHNQKCLKPFPANWTNGQRSYAVELDEKESQIVKLATESDSEQIRLISPKLLVLSPGNAIIRAMIDDIVEKHAVGAEKDKRTAPATFSETTFFSDFYTKWKNRDTKSSDNNDWSFLHLKTVFSYPTTEAIKWCQTHKHRNCNELLGHFEESASTAILSNIRDMPRKEDAADTILSEDELRNLLKENDISYDSLS